MIITVEGMIPRSKILFLKKYINSRSFLISTKTIFIFIDPVKNEENKTDCISPSPIRTNILLVVEIESRTRSWTIYLVFFLTYVDNSIGGA